MYHNPSKRAGEIILPFYSLLILLTTSPNSSHPLLKILASHINGHIPNISTPLHATLLAGGTDMAHIYAQNRKLITNNGVFYKIPDAPFSAFYGHFVSLLPFINHQAQSTKHKPKISEIFCFTALSCK